MTSKIIAIIEKNIKIMLNSKLSSLILILGPLILILLIGSTVQDTSIKNINAGIIVSEDDQFTDNFILKLKERSFNIFVEDSLDKCKENVTNGKNHVCIEINKVVESTGFETQQIASKEIINYNLILHVDFSKQRIVWGIIGSIQGVIDEESEIIRKRKIEILNSNLKQISEMLERNEHQIRNLQLTLGEIDNDLSNLEETRKATIASLKTIKSNLGFLKEELEASTISSELNAREQDLDTMIEELESSGLGQVRNSLARVKLTLFSLGGTTNTLNKDLLTLQNTDLSRITDPILLAYESVSNTEQSSSENKLEFLDFIFPTLIMIFILLSSSILSATLTVKERSSKANIRNIANKVSGGKIIFGNFIIYTALIFIQSLIIISIGKLLLGLNLYLNPMSSITIILISISLFVLLGIALGYIFNSQETAISGGILVGLILIMFSSIIIPIETLSGLASKIVKLTPSVILESKLHQSLIFNLPFSLSLVEILSLATSFLIVILLIGIGYKKSREMEI